MKTRLDIYLLENFNIESRERAKSYIMAGKVFINGQRASKCGDIVKDKDKVEFKGNKLKYVSRGGLKLEKAINKFSINLKDKICMDVGASTGGFTHCMILNGAKKVYSIDVGYGQLAWELRTNEKVINFERTNFRTMSLENIKDKIDFTSIDVSFISLELILPNAYVLMEDKANCVCLIKPQFECGKNKVGKKGVVKEKLTHIDVCKKIYDKSNEIGFSVINLDFSPIKGPEGNIEYLIYLKKDSNCVLNHFTKDKIIDIVELSHNESLGGC